MLSPPVAGSPACLTNHVDSTRCAPMSTRPRRRRSGASPLQGTTVPARGIPNTAPLVPKPKRATTGVPVSRITVTWLKASDGPSPAGSAAYDVKTCRS